MRAEIPIKPDEITSEQLLGVFRLFCQAYEINFDDYHRALGSAGIEQLKSGHLDYRPYMGAKFFGDRSTGGTSFHGYSDVIDIWPSDAGEEPAELIKEREKLYEQQKGCAREFERLVREHFKEV